jgi:hypothetical protein
MQVIQEQIELSYNQSSMAAVMSVAERPYCTAGVAYRIMLLACVPDLDSRLSSNFRDSNQLPSLTDSKEYRTPWHRVWPQSWAPDPASRSTLRKQESNMSTARERSLHGTPWLPQTTDAAVTILDGCLVIRE